MTSAVSATTAGHSAPPAPLPRGLLTTCLLTAPVLLTASELARLQVENSRVESEDAYRDVLSELDAVTAHIGLWHLAAWLDLAFILTWIGALVAAVIVIHRTRPWIATLTGVTAAVSVVGLSMHHAFYYQALADLAAIPGHESTARLLAQAGSDPLSVAALLMFLIGALLTTVILGIGMWRAHALPWWAAAGVLLWLGSILIASEATPAALLNLALLLPFAALARELATTAPAPAAPQAVETPS
jgi:hypothetical protein